MIFLKMNIPIFARKSGDEITVYSKFCLVISVLLVANSAWAGDDACTRNASLANEIEVHDQEDNDPEKELKERFETLKASAENKTLEDSVRIDKFLEIGTLELSIATQYLIDNIDYQIPIRWRADDDYLREHPCYYALLRKKKQVVPEILISLENDRDETSVKWIARLLYAAIGLEAATEILEGRADEVKDDSDYKLLRKNIEQVTQQLTEILDRRENAIVISRVMYLILVPIFSENSIDEECARFTGLTRKNGSRCSLECEDCWTMTRYFRPHAMR